MGTLVRTALIWLMAIALPLQAAAAAAMLSCGHGQHGAAVTHAHADDGVESAAHGTAHDHGVAHGDAESTAGSPVHKSGGKCSACASCCTVAALPASVPPIASPLGVDRVAPTFAVQMAVFMTGGLERPPRACLA